MLLLKTIQWAPAQERAAAASYEEPKAGLWLRVKALWCSHQNTFRTERSDDMPAHSVCRSCGWREPVTASRPEGTRTWDSSRDQARYEREKRRRDALALQHQMVVAERSVPSAREMRSRRSSRPGTVFEIARSATR